mgnify:CR=1 FL=1|tara:strand:- start:132 stop:461 length:330 start_codon:yes stop_codon:yes gene_type:complete
MKLSRTSLKALIAEELNKNSSLLLEMPGHPIVGQEQTGDYTKDPDGYEGEMAKRSLYHMAAQAQQLHDMIMEDENLEPWVQDKITKAADYLEKAFKAITYDKGPGQGRI